MTDERIDALIRRLDVPSDPDPEFVRSTYAALRPRARAARVSDASRFGRARRDLRLLVGGARWPSTARPVGRAGLVVLLVLATLLALAVVGALNRVQPVRSGPLIVSIRGELQAIDVDDGSVRAILPPGDIARVVSRSPDGRLVAFWTIGRDRSHLYVVGVDGQHRRELASDLSLAIGADAIDTWSSDSRFLATGVKVGGLPRIVVADVETGTARVVTPAGLAAQSPLWSPDGRWIAFIMDTRAGPALAVLQADGSGMRTVGNVVNVGGTGTWSPDGVWIYFGDLLGRMYRADAASGLTQRLAAEIPVAFAPISSPDGTLIAFMVDRPQFWDLYVANSDGTGAHRVLDHANNYGWSTDGRYVLAGWRPVGQPGGLAIVTPDGNEFRVVVPFAAGCPPDQTQTCIDGVGWGQPRP